MKKFEKLNGTVITIDDNGLATVTTPQQETYSLLNADGVRTVEELPKKIAIITNGKQVGLLGTDVRLHDWLCDNWCLKVTKSPKGWNDYKPASVKEYEAWRRAIEEYMDAINKSFETEEYVTVEKPSATKPVLDDDANAWLYIDNLCDSNAQGNYIAGMDARDAVVAGKLTLVEAAKQAKKDVQNYVDEHIWD